MADPNIDIVIDCADPETLAEFWAEALGYTKAGMFDPYYVLLAPTREHPPVILQRVPEPKTTKARIHFDVRSSSVTESSVGRRREPTSMWSAAAPGSSPTRDASRSAQRAAPRSRPIRRPRP